jgi:very-short-patch-repair endonuclease
VYAVGRPDLGPLGAEAAALLACGPRAVLSHWSAAVVWRLVSVMGGAVHVLVPGTSVRRTGIHGHRGTLATADVRVRHGLRVTSPMRTLLDLAEVTGPDVLERAVAEAEATLGVRHEALTEYAERATGRHGAGNLRAVLTRQGGPALTRSEAERRLLDLIRAAGLPAPEVNAPVAGWEVDFVWHSPPVAVEVDGYAFHSSPAAFERDHQKSLALGGAGYEPLRFTWRQITEQPAMVAAKLGRALAAHPS